MTRSSAIAICVAFTGGIALLATIVPRSSVIGSVAPVEEEKTTTITRVGSHAIEGNTDSFISIHRARLVGCTVVKEGPDTVVRARVNLFEGPQASRFLWQIRVRDVASGDHVVDQSYDHQVFTVGPQAAITPDFEERLQLPLGEYELKLRLHRFPLEGELDSSKLGTESVVAGKAIRFEVR